MRRQSEWERDRYNRREGEWERAGEREQTLDGDWGNERKEDK